MGKQVYLTDEELQTFLKMYEDAKRDREAMLYGLSDSEPYKSRVKVELENYRKLYEKVRLK